MSRTTIDLDDDACATIMRRYDLKTKRDAVNYALRLVAAEELTLEDARALRGSGWERDLADQRAVDVGQRIVEGYVSQPPGVPDAWGDQVRSGETGTKELLQRLDQEEQQSEL